MVYYGLSTTEYDRIIAKHPALVVLGDHRGVTPDTTPAYFHSRDADIRVLAYVPMNYGGSGLPQPTSCPRVEGVDGACANTPKSFDCSAMPITTRIQNVMAAGYDGVFFDETPNDKPNYVQNCATLVKNTGAQKIVAMNPGAVPSASMLSDIVDIVSVENQYTSNLVGFGVRSARFMAEQGDVNDAATALARLNTFRVNGGYWYYATFSYSKPLPSWFESFADAVNATTDEPHDCGSNPVHVAFRTYQNVTGFPEITTGLLVSRDGLDRHSADGLRPHLVHGRARKRERHVRQLRDVSFQPLGRCDHRTPARDHGERQPSRERFLRHLLRNVSVRVP